MALWELDEFKGPQFLGFVRSVPVPRVYRGATWLPDRTIFDLEFEYILGANEVPVMAHVMGFDSEAPIAGRPGLGQRVSGELPPIKRKAKMGEKEIIRFLAPRAGTPDVQTAIDSVYRQTAGLLDSIQARIEWLRMQALSEDTIVYDEGGVIFGFDYGITGKYQVDLTTQTNGAATDISSLVSTVWSDVANSNWVADLQYICDLIEQEKGSRPREFVCSNKAIGYMLNNAAARVMIRGSSAPTAVLTRPEIDVLVGLYNLPTISTYDVTVKKENADGSYSDVRTMAENKAFLVPGANVSLGETLFGPTAESRVLFGTPLAAQAPGVYAETYGTTEPPAEWVKAAAVAFPSLPGADTLGQMKLFA